MKSLNNIWNKLISIENLQQSIHDAAKGKLHYKHVTKVVDNDLFFAQKLHQLLLENKYIPSSYKTEIIKTESGKTREIFKLPFYPDRIVQHAISRIMKSRWDKCLTDDTYACINGRGINSKNKNYSLIHKVRKAIAEYNERKIYVLQLDIKKCYPNIDNLLLSKIYRETCRDKQVLNLLDLINFNSKGLPIGNYLSQLWSNLYLTKLDRFVKEVLKVKHYFRYMDDIVILSEDKHKLQQWKWRIMNFLWYELHLEVNSKRQIYPIAKFRNNRTLDYGGYVFYQNCTLLRKSIKKNFAKHRNKLKSIPSYLGYAKHCDSKNLINKILKENNMANLGDICKKKISRDFEGDKIKIDTILDKKIEILNFEIRDSKTKENTEYLMLQIRYEGKKCFIGGGYQFLIEILRDIDKSNLPFDAVIKYKRGYYFDGTLEE